MRQGGIIWGVCPVNEDPDNDMELARENGGVSWVEGERRVRWNPSGKHSLECHNYWIGRGIPCPYCKEGSVAVPRDEIIHGLKKKEEI